MNKKSLRFPAALLAAMLLATMLAASAQAAEKEKTILLTFTGDCTIGSDSTTFGRPRSFVETALLKGYDWFFANFKEMFAGDDCTVINLESVLTDYTSNEQKNKVYRFRGPRDYVNILKTVSIEACNLANNHTYDFGAQGLQWTQATLDENGIAWFMLYNTWDFVKDGIRIRFFSVDSRNLSGMFDWLKAEIARTKQEKEADAVVAIFHGGMEYSGWRDAAQQRFAEVTIGNGADLVIMHHPHVVQGIDIINQRTVCYSLGNFVFGGNNEIRTEPYREVMVTSLYSLVVQAELHFSEDGTYKGQQITLYPAYISGDPPHNDYQPRLVNGADGQLVFTAVQWDTKFALPAYDDEAGRIVMPYLPARAGVTTVDSGAGMEGIQ